MTQAITASIIMAKKKVVRNFFRIKRSIILKRRWNNLRLLFNLYYFPHKGAKYIISLVPSRATLQSPLHYIHLLPPPFTIITSYNMFTCFFYQMQVKRKVL